MVNQVQNTYIDLVFLKFW